MAPQRRRELGIRQLPPSLREAYEELNIDREFLKPIFDDEIIDSIILQEAKDHQDVTIRPHPHEFSLYADVCKIGGNGNQDQQYEIKQRLITLD